MAVIIGSIAVLVLAGAFMLGQRVGGPSSGPDQLAHSDAAELGDPDSVDLLLGPTEREERRAPRPTISSPQPAEAAPSRRAQQPAETATPSTPTPAREQEAAPQRIPSRQAGLTYLVLQEFPASARDEADRAQAFLAEHGMATTIERMANRRWQIVTLEGGDRTPEGRARLERLAEQAKEIGRAYARTGGRYRFHDPYWRTFSGGTTAP
jgi:hypothetical protein